MFWYYYIISGLIWAIICYRYYNKIVKDFPILEIVSKELFVTINFFFGFLNLPAATPVILRTEYLKYRIKITEKKNKEIERKINEMNNKLNKK